MFLNFRHLLPEMLVTLGTAILSIFWNDIEDPPSEYPPCVHGDDKHTETYLKTSDILNADTLGGLGVHGGTNNEANKVVRTDYRGYTLFGWINTLSGDTANLLSRVYVDTGDHFLRKCSLSHLMGQLRGEFLSYGSFVGNNAQNRVISTGLNKTTRIVWVMRTDGYQQWCRAGCQTLFLHTLTVGSFKINYNSAFSMNVSGYTYYWIAICF